MLHRYPNYFSSTIVILSLTICLLFVTVIVTCSSTNKPSVVFAETIDVAQFAYADSDAAGQNIYTINCDGSVINQVTNLSTGNSIISPPAWSPDGQKIAFSSAFDQTIYLVNLDGTDLTPLTTGAFPSWSPDGQKIAFQNDGGNPLAIYVIDIDGTNLQKIADIDSNGTPDWSFDGKRLVFVKSEDLYTYDFETLNMEQITNNPGSEWQPKWSPVDDRIAYLYSNGSGTGDIYIFDGGINTRITDSLYLEERLFDWSPDGTKISYGFSGSTYVMNADGTSPTLLFEDILAQAWRPGIDGCPRLVSNFSAGAPGSYFKVSGNNFPPNKSATITVNGHYFGVIPVDNWGAFQFSFNTSEASVGFYLVTATVNPSRTTQFEVNDLAPLRPPIDNTQIFEIPPNIAFTEFSFLPIIVFE